MVPDLPEKPRRTLDIGEEESDGAGREIVSHAPGSSAEADLPSSTAHPLASQFAAGVCSGESPLATLIAPQDRTVPLEPCRDTTSLSVTASPSGDDLSLNSSSDGDSASGATF